MIVFDSTQKAAWSGGRFSNIGASPQRGDVGSAGDQICALTLRGKPMEKTQGDPKGTPQPKCISPCFTVFHRVSPCFTVFPCIEIGWKHVLTLP